MPGKFLKKALVVAGVAVVLAAPSVASAAPIHILTGVNAANTVIGQDALDPFWTISVQGGAFNAARAAAPGHAIICCGMETAGAQALWISDPSISVGSIATGWGIGPTAVARRSFDLTGFDLSTVTISGIWRIADFRQGVFINGNLVMPGTTNDNGQAWFADQAFSLAAGSGFFVAGINTLELRGSSGNSTWDGFWLDATVDGRVGNSEVPEPTTLTLLGLGLAVGVRARMRRR